MGRRRGQGQILTADQLADQLAIPCFYILTGRANAAFPYTSVPGPSPFVKVVLTRPVVNAGDLPFFNTTVHWKQWHLIIAPILEDLRMSNYLGRLGGEPNSTRQVGQGLYGCSTSEFIDILRGTIRLRAIAGGYGNPDQQPLAEGSC